MAVRDKWLPEYVDLSAPDIGDVRWVPREDGRVLGSVAQHVRRPDGTKVARGTHGYRTESQDQSCPVMHTEQLFELDEHEKGFPFAIQSWSLLLWENDCDTPARWGVIALSDRFCPAFAKTYEDCGGINCNIPVKWELVR